MALSIALPAAAAPEARTVADGITLTQDINTDPKSPLVVTVLRVDPRKPGVRIAAALAQDRIIADDATNGRETVSSIVSRKAAVAGVNADYFPFTGDPLGLAILEGSLVSEPADRAALGVTAAGAILFDRLGFSGRVTASSGASYAVGGLNRPRGKSEIVFYTTAYGPATGAADGVEAALVLDGPVRANANLTGTAASDPAPIPPVPIEAGPQPKPKAAAPSKPAPSGTVIPPGGAVLSAAGPAAQWLKQNVHGGDKITLRLDIKAASGRSWDSVVEAVGGGPWLVRGGEVYTDAQEERFDDAKFTLVRHPRTAAGVTESGELLLVTVDGRQTISQGMTIAELAELMKKLGAVDAINLDGGGSTTLSIRGAVVNSPSGRDERPVANALVVHGVQAVTGTGARFADAGPLTVPAGAARTMTVLYGINSPSEIAASRVTWGTTGAVGFINQKGYFIPMKAGKGSVVAFYQGTRCEAAVTVVPGPPTKLAATIVFDASNAPNRGLVAVALTDDYGNAIAGKVVTLSATGAVPDAPTATTDDKGTATFGLTWDSTPSAASVTVSADGLSTKAK